MSRKRSLAALVLVPTALALATVAAAHSTWPALAPFGKYLVYTAASVYDPLVLPAERDSAGCCIETYWDAARRMSAPRATLPRAFRGDGPWSLHSWVVHNRT